MKRGFIDGEYQDGEVRGLVFLAGKRGMGKTTEMARLLSTCRGGVIFFDTLSKHAHILKNYLTIFEPADLVQHLRANRRGFRVLYQPWKNRAAHFDAVCDVVRIVGRECGGLVLAVDEVDRFTDANLTPAPLSELIECGRHYHVAMLCTARKPAQVPRAFTSECGEFRLFRTTENRYVKYWADTMGDDQTAATLRTLPKYQYILWRDGEEPEILSAGRLAKKIF